MTTVYDGNGKAAVTIDPMGQASQSGYDALGRVGAGIRHRAN